MLLCLELWKLLMFLIIFNQSRAKLCSYNFSNSVKIQAQKKSYDGDPKLPLIRICCPHKNILANGECNDGLEEEMALFNPFLNLFHWNGSLQMTQYNIIDMTVLREKIQYTDRLLNLRENEFKLFENGSLLRLSMDSNWMQDDYCLYPYHFYSAFPKSIWIVIQKDTTECPPGILEISFISLVCQILTILVYLYVKELRNVIGKCLTCSLFCLFTADLFFYLDKLNLLNDFCSLAGYIKYFFTMAYFHWLSVISYHLWNGFRSARDKNPSYRFLRYNVLAWGTAAIPTGIIFLMNQGWEKDADKCNWLPLVGFSNCSVNYEKWSAWIYYFGPILVQNTFSVIMLILTATHILKVKRQLKRFRQREELTPICCNFDIQTYLEFLRLSALMGATWLLNFTTYLVQSRENIWRPILLAKDYFNLGFGIFVFMLLILKRSTFRMIINRIQKGRR